MIYIMTPDGDCLMISHGLKLGIWKLKTFDFSHCFSSEIFWKKLRKKNNIERGVKMTPLVFPEF